MKILYILLVIVSLTLIVDILNTNEKILENKTKEKVNLLFSNLYKHKYSTF